MTDASEPSDASGQARRRHGRPWSSSGRPEPAGMAREAGVGPRGGTGSRRRLVLIVAPIAVLVVLSNVGDALAPTLVDTHPLLLIALNARNRNLVLVSNLLDPLSYYLVGTLRLLAADPPFYALGWFYGDAAVTWIESKTPTLGRYARQFEAAFGRAAYPLVFLAPNNFICLFAGSSGMRPVWFVTLNLTGTVARLYVLRVFGDIFSDQVDWVLDFIQEYRWWLTALTILLVSFSVLTERRQGKGELEAIAELVEHEPPASPQHGVPGEHPDDHDDSGPRSSTTGGGPPEADP